MRGGGAAVAVCKECQRPTAVCARAAVPAPRGPARTRCPTRGARPSDLQTLIHAAAGRARARSALPRPGPGGASQRSTPRPARGRRARRARRAQCAGRASCVSCLEPERRDVALRPREGGGRFVSRQPRVMGRWVRGRAQPRTVAVGTDPAPGGPFAGHQRPTPTAGRYTSGVKSIFFRKHLFTTRYSYGREKQTPKV